MKAPWKKINEADAYVMWTMGRERVHTTQENWYIETALGKRVSEGRMTALFQRALTAISLTDFSAEKKQQLALFFSSFAVDVNGDPVESNMQQLRRYVPQNLWESADRRIDMYYRQ